MCCLAYVPVKATIYIVLNCNFNLIKTVVFLLLLLDCKLEQISKPLLLKNCFGNNSIFYKFDDCSSNRLFLDIHTCMQLNIIQKENTLITRWPYATLDSVGKINFVCFLVNKIFRNISIYGVITAWSIPPALGVSTAVGISPLTEIVWE